MVIKITCGIFGYRPTIVNASGVSEMSPYVVPVTANDPPVDVDEETAARLIASGYAVAVEDIEPVDEPTIEDDLVEDEDYSALTLSQIKDILRDRGIEFPKNINKTAALKLLDDADVVE